MADTAQPGSVQDGPQQDGPQQRGGEVDQSADAARRPAAAATRTAPDHAVLSEEPPTGGLTAVLGKLRDAAAAHDDEPADPGGHDDELADPGGSAQHS
jgi:hypothetical protein